MSSPSTQPDLYISMFEISVPTSKDSEPAGLVYVISGKTADVVATARLSPWMEGRRPYLSDFVVDAKHRRQGIGRKMLRYICSATAARGIDAVALWLDKGNEAAESLYIDEGFLPATDDKDRIYLVKHLEPTAEPINA